MKIKYLEWRLVPMAIGEGPAEMWAMKVRSDQILTLHPKTEDDRSWRRRRVGLLLAVGGRIKL